jgi:hypothetical protein
MIFVQSEPAIIVPGRIDDYRRIGCIGVTSAPSGVRRTEIAVMVKDRLPVRASVAERIED